MKHQEIRIQVGVTLLEGKNKISSKNVDIGVISKKVKNLYKDTKEIANDLGLYSTSKLGDKVYNLKYNTYVLAYKGVNSTSGFNEMLYSVCGILIAVIMIGSILVIYNSFAISVSERKKQFGMLSSVGATKKQIRKSVIYEGAILGSIGIPIGIISGILGIGITLNIVNNLLKPMFVKNMTNISLHLIVSWQAIVIAAVLIGITIYLSVVIPARRASKVSPIEAIRGNSEIKIKAKKLKTLKIFRKLFGIEGEMALKNLKRSRKKYRTTVISLMISIVLFISVSGFVDYMYGGFDSIYKSVDYDYLIRVSKSNNENQDEQINELRNQIENSKNIDKLSIIDMSYGTTKFGEEKLDSNMKKAINEKKEVKELFFEENNKYEVTVRAITLNEKQMEDYLKKVGVSNLKNNEVILINYVDMIMNAHIEGELTSYKEQDNFTIELNNYEEEKEDRLSIQKTYKLAKVTDEMPFGIENIGGPELIIVMESQEFQSLQQRNSTIMVFTAKNETDLESELKQIESRYTSGNIYIENIKEQVQQQRNLKLIINIFLYGFIALISAIGIANIFNTISTNIILRKREFAMLKSIGMTEKGFKKMLDLECFFYGTKALLFGLPIGILICYFINKGFGNLVEFAFNLPWSSIIISIVSVYLVVFITMLYSSSKIKKENIIDVLRDENI